MAHGNDGSDTMETVEPGKEAGSGKGGARKKRTMIEASRKTGAEFSGPGTSRRVDEWEDQMRKGKKMAKVTVVGIVFLALVAVVLASSITNAPAGHKAVVVSGYGNIGGQYDEGLRFKSPLEQVDYVRYNTQRIEETISILTADEYNVPIDFQATFHLMEERVGEIHTSNPDYKDTVLRNILRSEARRASADMGLTGEQVNKQRSAFAAEVETRVAERVAEYYIVIESVNIRNINLPPQILNAAEMRAAARIDIETAEYELQAERARAQKEMVKAQAEANSTVILALGQAESLSILAQESDNMTTEVMDYILALRYIAALRDPDSNVNFVIVPMDGPPLILDAEGLQAAAAGGSAQAR